MNKIDTAIRISRHDDLYQKLVDLHDGRTEEESRKINAKLILVMMNQIGDFETLSDIFDLVQQSSEKWH